MLLVAGMVSALADSSTVHTITITNTDPAKQHTYEAYQVFAGNLDATEQTLSDITWGAGVNSSTILGALQSSTDAALKAVAGDITEGKDVLGKNLSVDENVFKNALTAADVAKIVSGFGNNSARLSAFAAIVAGNLSNNVAGTSTATASPYSISVTGDGYYFVKDKDGTVTVDGETYTKYILNVVRDVSIEAKDTHTGSDKKIVESSTEVDDNDKAIGDEIVYKATMSPLPDPTKFTKGFKLEMTDTMEAGLTFTELTSIVLSKTGAEDKTLTLGSDYNVYYRAHSDSNWTGDPEAAGTTWTKLTAASLGLTSPADTNATNTATDIRIVFHEPRTLIKGGTADDNLTYVGGTLTVNYKAVLNKYAEIAPGSNDNTNRFVYSNNPNNTYEGDWFKDDDVKGETPDKTVETYTTTIWIKKVDGNNQALEGATFTITSTAFNTTLVTAIEFIKVGEAYPAGAVDDNGDALTGTITTGTYWALNDGTFTTTDPNTLTNKTQYKTPLTDKYAKVKISKLVKTPVSNTYTLVSGADGYIKLEGVKEGEYTITEIKAPDGYNLLPGNKVIDIDWTNIHALKAKATRTTDEQKLVDAGGFHLGTNSSEGVTMDATGAHFDITIENQQGNTLPSTGGIGTTLFYIGGSILVLAAVILLVTKRRMGSSND